MIDLYLQHSTGVKEYTLEIDWNDCHNCWNRKGVYLFSLNMIIDCLCPPIAAMNFNFKRIMQDFSIDDLKAKAPDWFCHNSAFKYSTNFIFSGCIRLMINLVIYHIWGEHHVHYTTKVVNVSKTVFEHNYVTTEEGKFKIYGKFEVKEKFRYKILAIVVSDLLRIIRFRINPLASSNFSYFPLFSQYLPNLT